MSDVRVAGVTKSFGDVEVLRGVDLVAESGSLVAVLGPSGCGKTTLLRVLAGFERADSGSVVVGGVTLAGTGDGAHMPPHKRRIAVVPQEGALFPHLSVAGNIAFGLPRADRRGPRVAELLALAGLDGLGDRMPHELSGGQQQRVALARALAPRPAVVLLDEPFAALDTGLRAALREEVRSVLAAAGATTILVTHDQEEALSLATSVAVMREGRIVQQGAPSDVYARPADAGVATFLGDANLLPAVASGSSARCALGSVALVEPASGAVTLLVRPEQLAVAPGGPAVVVSLAYYGHDAMLGVRLPDGSALRVRTPAAQSVPAGTEVTVTPLAPVVALPD